MQRGQHFAQAGQAEGDSLHPRPFSLGLRPVALGLLAALLVSCLQDPAGGTSRSDVDPIDFRHRDRMVAAQTAALDSITFTSRQEVSSFLGGSAFRLVFGHQGHLYLYTSESDSIWKLTRGDEQADGELGKPNSPMISPDGRWVAYTGQLSLKAAGPVAFVQELRASSDSVHRRVLDTLGSAAEPRWHVDPATGDTMIYFTATTGGLAYDSTTGRIEGQTWKKPFKGGIPGTRLATGLPGGFKGGLSRDGRWAGTAYLDAALYDITTGDLRVLACGAQQCNPSMNAFSPGSTNSDYFMLLSFGNFHEKRAADDACRSLVTTHGEALYEGQHENLWIYNRDNRVTHRVPRPDSAYQKLEKPEWSTHPRFATMLACRPGFPALTPCDLYLVRLPELADRDRSNYSESLPEDFLKLADGGFTTLGWSHLWLAP